MVVYTLHRSDPYSVEVTGIRMASGKRVLLAFGRTVQTPFSNVSNIEKRNIGIALKEYVYA
jgi:hypothetical protein